jgi:hypothetical protein
VLASQIWEYFHPQEAQQPSDFDQIPDDQVFEDQIPEQRIPGAQLPIEIEAAAPKQANSNPEHLLELAC